MSKIRDNHLPRIIAHILYKKITIIVPSYYSRKYITCLTTILLIYFPVDKRRQQEKRGKTINEMNVQKWNNKMLKILTFTVN